MSVSYGDSLSVDGGISGSTTGVSFPDGINTFMISILMENYENLLLEDWSYLLLE
jgi:hypothetical protein